MSLGLQGGHVTALAIDPRAPEVVLAAADEGGVFRSTDSGQTWARASRGLEASLVPVLQADLSVAHRWWAATNRGLSRTDDDGAHWVSVSTGLTGPGASLTSLVLDGSALYVASNVTTVGSNASVRRSTDQGATWQVLTIPFMDAVLGFAARGSWLLAASWSGLWISTDGGANWAQAMGGLASSLVDGVALDPTSMDVVYASTTLGLSISTDRGATFTTAAGGLPAGRLDALFVTGAGVFASQGTATFRSVDHGATWVAVSLDTRRQVTAVAADASRPMEVLAGARGTGLFRSADGAATWAPSSTGFEAVEVTAIATDVARPDVLLAGSRTSGTFRSVDRGQTWSPVLDSVPALGSTDALALEGDVAWAMVNTPALGQGTVLRSVDRGATWADAAGGLPGGPYRGFLATSTRVLINKCFGDVFANDGSAGAFTALTMDAGVCVSQFAMQPGSPNHLFAASGAGAPNDGVLVSVDDGATWSVGRAGLPATVIPGPLIFDGAQALLLGVSGGGGGLWASTDLGQTWAAKPGLLGEVRVLLADEARGALYAATTAALFRSTDHGTTWLSIDFGLPTIDVVSLAVGEGPDLLFAGTRAAGLYVFRDPDVTSMPTSPDGGTGTGVDGVFGRCGCSEGGGALVLLALSFAATGARWRSRRSSRAP